MNTSETQIDQPLQHLANALRRDPESWSEWYGLHLEIQIKPEANPLPYPQEDLDAFLHIALRNKDYTAHYCQDGEVILIAHDIPPQELHMLAHEVGELLKVHGYSQTAYHLYHLQNDWRQFAFICERKQVSLSSPPLEITGLPEPRMSRKEADELFALYAGTCTTKRFRRKKKVMVVEDDPLTRKIVSKILKDEVDLVVADNLHEGLVHYALHAPDIVFLDINLEHTNDGKVFLSTVRHYDRDSQIVMFSGNSYLQNMIQTLEMGADGFVSKPFRKEQLMHYIDRVA